MVKPLRKGIWHYLVKLSICTYYDQILHSWLETLEKLYVQETCKIMLIVILLIMARKDVKKKKNPKENAELLK